jgi:hypothetical protein
MTTAPGTGTIRPLGSGRTERRVAVSHRTGASDATSRAVQGGRLDQGKPGVTRGRKATGLGDHSPIQSAGLPKARAGRNRADGPFVRSRR